VPPSQSVHCDAPNEAAKEPGEQGEGDTEPVEHALPGGHRKHSDEEESWVEFEYDPAGHGSGEALPGGQKLPAGQGSWSTVAAVGQ
jgi:hypothetical protein